MLLSCGPCNQMSRLSSSIHTYYKATLVCVVLIYPDGIGSTFHGVTCHVLKPAFIELADSRDGGWTFSMFYLIFTHNDNQFDCGAKLQQCCILTCLFCVHIALCQTDQSFRTMSYGRNNCSSAAKNREEKSVAFHRSTRLSGTHKKRPNTTYDAVLRVSAFSFVCI